MDSGIMQALNALAAVDGRLFKVINGFVGTFPLFDRFMATMVNEYFVPVTMTLGLVALWFAGGNPGRRYENQHAVIYAVLAQILANAMIAVNNHLYFRPRPFADMIVNMLFYEPTDSSLPSNPAAVGFAFATAVWLVNRWAGALLFVLATLFAVSRVYSGVHYPLDIVGGALVGALAAAITVALGRHYLAWLVNGIIRLAQRLYLA